MTASMTAFSRHQAQADWGSLSWEIRSVNHRYLETSVRLPDLFRGMENAVRESIRNRLARGKVECQLHYRPSDLSTDEIAINTTLVDQLIKANQKIQQQLGTATPISSMDLLQWPGVIGKRQLDIGTIESSAMQLFGQALDDLVLARLREGTDLEAFLRQRIESMRSIIGELQLSMPDILKAQRLTLLHRLDELKVELNLERLEQELILLVSKADVDEELDRLTSHLSEVERVLATTGPKGRRLDFLMQELNRESNTLCSKSVVIQTTRHAVELRVLTEQMREQIQNIE